MTQHKEIPPMHVLKTLAKKFMTTAEIENLGLNPKLISAGDWRNAGIENWVLDFLPDSAYAASYCSSCEQTPNVLENIVIWNTDTFDISGLDLDQRTYAEIEKDYKELDKV